MARRKRKRSPARSPSPTPKSSIAASWKSFTAKDLRHCVAAAARVQRPLWASTGTKNPAYSDVLYVENLIGPETVNTLPPDTINAFRDHGKIPGAMVKQGFDEADAALASLARLGISLDAITEKLQVDGVAAFAASFDQLMGALEKKRTTMVGAALNRQEMHLGKFQRRVEKRLQQWQNEQTASRIWKKDHTVWSQQPQVGIG